MLRKLGFTAFAAVALMGCDAAGEIAGDALDAEIRSQIAGQCEAVAENAGIAADRLTAVCDCTADTFLSDPDLTVDDIRPSRIEEIANECARQTGEPNATSGVEAPAEDNGV